MRDMDNNPFHGWRITAFSLTPGISLEITLINFQENCLSDNRNARMIFFKPTIVALDFGFDAYISKIEMKSLDVGKFCSIEMNGAQHIHINFDDMYYFA